MEQALATAQSEWARRQIRAELNRPGAPTRPATPTPRPGPTGRSARLPAPPAWWKGDEDAARSSLVAAQQLRQVGR